MSDAQEKLKALKLTIDRLEKTYGKGVVMKMDETRTVQVDTVSTGSLGLDLVRNRRVKPPSPCILLPKHRRKAAFVLS